MPHLVVIGAGIAGLSAARSARAGDPDARITLITAEACLPYYRPDLSKNYLAEDRENPQPSLATDRLFAEASIDLLTGWPVREVDLDGRMLHGDRGSILFDRLLLASGAAANLLPIEGAHLDGVCTLRTLADARRLRERLRAAHGIVVIGGGLIGMEVAATARSLGKRVTVIEQADRVLSRTLPAEIADLAASCHREQGVEILSSVAVRRFTGDDRLRSVETSIGSVPADLAVVAIGVRPDTALAEAAGIETRDGVLVDSRCRTSAPGVFAAGDAARARDEIGGWRLESWRHAEQHGEAAGRNLAGLDSPYVPAPWFWSDQADLHIQGCGLPVEEAEQIIRPGSNPHSRFLFQRKGGRVVSGFGISRDGGLARDIGFLAPLLARDAILDPFELADPAVSLKAILRRASPAGTS